MPTMEMHPVRGANVTKLFFLVCLAWLTSGCATLMDRADIQKPSVTLEQTKLNGLSLSGIEILVTLNIQNPNPFAIKLAGFDYDLAINQHKVSGGQQREPIEIGSHDSALVSVPVQLNFTEVFKLIDGLAERDSISYEIDTTTYVDVPVIGLQSIASTLAKSFPLPKQPDISVTRIKVNSFDFAGANITLGLEVKNPNAFSVDMSKLDYRLSVGDEEWVRTKMDHAATLAAKGVSEMEVPLQVNFFDMGGMIFNALKAKRPLEYQLQGNMVLDTPVPFLNNVEVPFDQVGQVNPDVL